MNTPTTNLDLFPIAVDAMGGDHGPRVVVEGAVAALRELNIQSVLVGNQDEIRSVLSSLGVNQGAAPAVVHAAEVITMEDSPSRAIRSKPQSSIRVAFELVRDGKAAAVVSPGNTGAVMAAGMFTVGTIPGVVRPAVASIVPRTRGLSPIVLLDSGANIDCHAEQLVQFALMGSCYAQSVTQGVEPRIALLSNGSEPSKGTDVIRAAAARLAVVPGVRFVGYVEGRDLWRDVADVVVCDGFVGNAVLKAIEGSVEFVLEALDENVNASLRGRLGNALLRPVIKSLRTNTLDPSAYGGAPLLGLSKIAVICHGAAGSRAIMNGIRVAHKCAIDNLVEHVESALGGVDAGFSGSY